MKFTHFVNNHHLGVKKKAEEAKAILRIALLVYFLLLF
jgi:hypothetical protein